MKLSYYKGPVLLCCYTVFDVNETTDCMHIFEMLLNEMFWCLLPFLRRVVRVL